MKPVIGITSDGELESKFALNEQYVEAVIRAGGLPIILPTGIEEDVTQVVGMLDGLMLTGGGDIDPMLFGEEPLPGLGEVSPARDSLEIALIHQMLEVDKPILGICRGQQILNVAFGGNIYQDIYTQHDKPLLQHSQKAPRSHQSHFVNVKKDTLFASIVQDERIQVNSYHHQAVKDVLKPLVVSGIANDGVIETIESPVHHFVLGVQWHPEALADKGDIVSLRLFEEFIDQSRDRRT